MPVSTHQNITKGTITWTIPTVPPQDTLWKQHKILIDTVLYMSVFQSLKYTCWLVLTTLILFIELHPSTTCCTIVLGILWIQLELKVSSLWLKLCQSLPAKEMQWWMLKNNSHCLPLAPWWVGFWYISKSIPSFSLPFPSNAAIQSWFSTLQVYIIK